MRKTCWRLSPKRGTSRFNRVASKTLFCKCCGEKIKAGEQYYKLLPDGKGQKSPLFGNYRDVAHAGKALWLSAGQIVTLH